MEHLPRQASSLTPDPDRELAQDVTVPARCINKVTRFHEKYTDESGEPATREFDVAVIRSAHPESLPFAPAWRLELGPLVVAVSRPID